MKLHFLLLVTSIVLVSCQMPEQMEEMQQLSANLMTDMQFKNSMYCIEMHHLRFGVYPESLDEIEFVSEMDKAYFNGVMYEKLPNGYRLDIKEDLFQGVIAELEYPEEFWNGLGLVESNLKQ